MPLFVGLLTRAKDVFGFPVMGQSLRFLARVSMTGKSISQMNRACPIANAANRLDNHGHWIRNRVSSKAEWLFLPLFRAVNHAGVTARGFVWLTVSREIPKAPNSSHLNDVSSISIPKGLLFATD